MIGRFLAAPWRALQRRKYRRRYNAALLLYLGHYGFLQLSPEQKARIDNEVDAMYRRYPDPRAAYNQMSWDWTASMRIVAMARLGIEPMADTPPLRELLEPWKSWIQWDLLLLGLGKGDYRPTGMEWDYLPFQRATFDAKDYLRGRGLDIPEIDPKAPA